MESDEEYIAFGNEENKGSDDEFDEHDDEMFLRVYQGEFNKEYGHEVPKLEESEEAKTEKEDEEGDENNEGGDGNKKKKGTPRPVRVIFYVEMY